MAVIDIPGFIEKLNNGEIDLDTWAAIVNSNDLTVPTRLNGNVNTWKGLQAALSAATGLVYTTKAAMDAAPGTKEWQAARVTEDGANNGLYIWSGSAWVKTNDPLDAAADIGRRNGIIISGEITKMRFISAGTNANSWVIDMTEILFDFGAGRGFVRVSSVKDLIVPLNRAAIVDLRNVDPTAGPTVSVEVLTSDPASASYGPGAFVDDLRIPLFINRSSNNVGRYGGAMTTKIREYSTGDVWFSTAASTTVSYDDATRTLSSNGLFFCPFQENKSNRINLPAFSIVIPNANYQTVWIDKTMIPADGGNLPLEAIKVGGYNEDAETDYQSMPHQLAIFCRERSGRYYSVGSFPSITPPVPPVTIKTGLSFVKQANSASLYFDGGGSKKIEIPLIREVVPWDGTSASSQKDLWRLNGGYEVDAGNVRGNTILSTGEWELAIRENATTDSIGGYHGDELMTEAMFFVNGAQLSQTALRSIAEVKSVGLVQNSFIYKQNVQAELDPETNLPTGTNAAIKHHKNYQINPNGIRLKQRAEFLQAMTITSAWGVMLPILRYMNFTSGPLITDRVLRSRNGVIEDVSTWVDGSQPVYLPVEDGDTVMLWGQTSGIYAEVTFVKRPNIPTTKMYISTNTDAYNKVYCTFRGDPNNGDPQLTANVGDIWEWETFYKITTAN